MIDTLRQTETLHGKNTMQMKDQVEQLENQMEQERVNAVRREADLNDRLETEGLRLQAANEKAYREMERRYMKDFAEILQIDLPQQLMEYGQFSEMAKSKIKRLHAKIDMLMQSRDSLRKVHSPRQISTNNIIMSDGTQAT